MIVGKDVKEYKASEKHAIDSQKTPILEVVDFKVSADGPENSFILDPNEVLESLESRVAAKMNYSDSYRAQKRIEWNHLAGRARVLM
jgi:hypothetical protein